MHSWVVLWYHKDGDFDPLVLGTYERLQDAEEDHIDWREGFETVRAEDRVMVWERGDEVFKIVNPPVVELGDSLDEDFPQ